jgi:outer membrane lipoprotein-sorting protein
MVSLRTHLALNATTDQAAMLTTHAGIPRPRLRSNGILVVWITVGLWGFVGVAFAATSPVDGWLKTQTNIQSWSAAVKQIRFFKTLAQPLEERGRVWFSAPNRFRWEIGTPAKTIAIREPEQMLVIYPKLKRAERFPLDGQAGPWKDTLALLEAGFPRSQAELEARFKILSQSCSNNLCEVRLQPRAASARRMMPEVRITFAEGNALLQATELHFADGSYIRNEFSDATLNPPLEPSLFQPRLEADVQVVEPLKQKSP